MDSLINFRDFGGYDTGDGRRVRRDRLFRCGHMAEISDEALEHLVGLDFNIIVDLRYANEREQEPSAWPEHLEDRVLSHDGARMTEAPHMEAASVEVEVIERFWLSFYPALPFNPHYWPLFAEAIRRIATHDGRTLIHCTAGKDRTGLLRAHTGRVLTEAAALWLVDVRPHYLEGALAEIRKRCGSLEAYLAAEGVDETVIQRLRNRLLE
jgi:protein-tyrosine phosphatase